jgi:Uri superfamily endonuclease
MPSDTGGMREYTRNDDLIETVAIEMKGVYVLLLELPEDRSIQVGKLGKIAFEHGYYAYVGSALNGLESRIKRHLRKEKKKHWHIDHLLEESVIEEVVFAETTRRVECDIADGVDLRFISGFGCTDCGCESHLFHSHDFDALEDEILNAFRKNELNPEQIKISGDEYRFNMPIHQR